MAQESTYRNIYFDMLKEYAEGRKIDNVKNNFRHNFSDCPVYDKQLSYRNEKIKYTLQGTNPLKYIKKLTNEINLTTTNHVANQEFKILKNKLLKSDSIHIQNVLKCEGIVWKLISQIVTADHIFFQRKEDESLDHSIRTPLSLITVILKNNHDLLSYHYILKWLETIYKQDKFLSRLNLMKYEGLYKNDIDDYANNLNNSDSKADELTYRYLYESMRAGNLDSAKESVSEVNQAWKGHMLKGITPMFDNIIDPTVHHSKVENISPSEISSQENSSGNPNWFLYLKAASYKSEDKRVSPYEKALYGSF